MKTVYRFTADWCGPCKVYAPIFNSLISEYDKVKFEVVDIDSENGSKLATQHNVKSIPTTVVVDGESVKSKVGIIPKYELVHFIEN